MTSLGGRARSALARGVRRGNRTVLLTGDWARFGNFLYYWLHAHKRVTVGQEYRVLTAPSVQDWLPLLPSLKDNLAVEPEEVRWFDRREWPPPPYLFQRFGVDFLHEDLSSFVENYLRGSELLATPENSNADSGWITLNVRRGDYYSNPKHRANFGMNIQNYVRSAMRLAFDAREHSGVLVVSDDLDWCRRNLHENMRSFTASIEYGAGENSAMGNFRLVSAAKTLICANSTFSYWGGYVSMVMHGEESLVIAPTFHARHVLGGRAFQLAPAWRWVSVEGVGIACE